MRSAAHLPACLEQIAERVGVEQTGQRVHRPAVEIEHQVETVPRQRALDLLAVSEVDRHARHRPHGLPVQHISR